MDDLLRGTPVHVSAYMCQNEFIRWRRTHRKSRINKKWKKKYGPVTQCKGHAYQVGADYYVCPCIWAAMSKVATLLPKQQQ